MKKIGIIDYGMGNLHSVKNALDFIGADSFVSDDVNELSQADGLILPGVGAFPDAMARLSETGLDKFIREYVKTKPLIGICLGMQLLFDKSYEFRECEGLGLIGGEVVKIEETGLKVPHMGWNELSVVNPSPITSTLKTGDQVYFVHSYKAIVKDRADLVAVTDYGSEVTAIVARGNVYGCQFHPEKSETVGLNILRNFWSLIQ
ncbi:MAG: imidazole glycerol phosphate synthase subunit HisH [Clostridia bacterium]|nr:imidazole glycerol phosphate synthase subunit HisH [Clostridia bacterium]